MTLGVPLRIVVAGASAGGVEALTALTRELPADLPVPVVVVLHVPALEASLLPAILDRVATLPARAALDGLALAPGCIYVAVPARHVTVGAGRLRLDDEPPEHGHRPAIDPLFRSAASSYGAGAVGIVLSGLQADGAAGLAAIKRRGGWAMVQDPHEALHAGMPRAAIARGRVDDVAEVHELAALLRARVLGDAAASRENVLS
jgi:two-component system chemotaxis response regulator CheB